MSIYNKFHPAIEPPENLNGDAMWFIFREKEILIDNNSDTGIPEAKSPEEFELTETRKLYLGRLDARHCFALEVDSGTPAPSEMQFADLRQSFQLVDEHIFALAGRAFQIIQWDKNHQHCGRCGTATQDISGDRAKKCSNCGLVSYPRISPAVIVRVKRGTEILLSRSYHFKKGVYSVQAGFVEPGEKLEDAVAREVEEEIGIKIKNIKYFGSQPWPFPDSLMIGFTAEYASGELKIDTSEIEDAGWYPFNKLPQIPGKMSIARHLIDNFLRECS